MSDAFELVIIGGGPAGLETARAFREAGGVGSVAIIGDEGRLPYQRPALTKELLRGAMPESELPLVDAAWLTDHQVAFIAGRAVELQAATHRVVLSGGRELGYRRCVLATGSEPVRLAVPGADDPGVLALRSLDHLRELQAQLLDAMPVTVIGSGFIGCEIAASLAMRGHPVTLVADETWPNARRLGDAAGERIARWLAELGVELVLGSAVDRIERHGAELTVAAGDAKLHAPIVVMAAGVTPRTELAAAAGAHLDGAAVAVDATMHTTAPDLLAAGDITFAVNLAAGRRLRVEHWGDALGQGAVAGRAAAGAAAGWSEVPGFWSTIGEQTLKYAAWGDGHDAVAVHEHGDGFVVRYGLRGRLVAVLAHEADDAYSAGREQVAAGTAWSRS